MTDTTDIKALREAALKATPGPWVTVDYFWIAQEKDGHGGEFIVFDNGPDAAYVRNLSPDRILALLDRLEAERQRREAAEKERDDLLNQEFQQRLANAEHQLEMKDLAISNVKASRMAQFRKRKAAEAELERRDGLTGEMIYQERRFHVKGKSQIEYWADVNVSTYGYLHESQRRILYVAAGGIVKDGE